MAWWQAVILGIVEGITEYLPVSSTGHLVLAAWALGLDDPSHKGAVDAFHIVVQGGAILAVLGLYRDRVRQMALGLVGRDPAGRRLLVRLLVAFLPAAVAGFLVGDVVEQVLFRAGPVLAALAVGGVFLVVLGRRPPPVTASSLDELTIPQAFGIGVLQCVALWPGTSRSMMTIAGGLFAGLPPGLAAEFSFLLGLPTLGAACVYTLLRDLGGAAFDGSPSLFTELGVGPVVLGIVTATLSAAIAIDWLVGFLSRRGLEPFGWYRLALAGVAFVLAAVGLVEIG